MQRLICITFCLLLSLCIFFIPSHPNWSSADGDPLDSGSALGFFPQGSFSWTLSHFSRSGGPLDFFVFSLIVQSALRSFWMRFSTAQITVDLSDRHSFWILPHVCRTLPGCWSDTKVRAFRTCLLMTKTKTSPTPKLAKSELARKSILHHPTPSRPSCPFSTGHYEFLTTWVTTTDSLQTSINVKTSVLCER